MIFVRLHSWVSLRLGAFCFLVFITAGCATSFNPQPIDQVGFMSRAQTQVYDKVSITVAVPSKDEAIELFDRKLYKKGVQPVWVKIRNDYHIPIIFMLHHMDADYYSPAEASFKTRYKSSKKLSLEKNRYFQQTAFPGLTVPPGEEYSGFVFVNLDEGTKSVVVTLMGRHQMKTFVFIVPVPGFDADYLSKDIDSIYSEDEYIDFDDDDALRAALADLPRSVKNKEGTKEGDPLNLVLVGEFHDIIAAFTRAGWDETHVLKTGSAIKTATSHLFGSSYRYSPISDLYVFGRSQDVSFQKARKTTSERNHMRFWKTPYRTMSGRSVWIGQISRDIGVKYTFKTGGISTHVVDPDVDNDRNYVFQDLINAQAVNAIGFVKGVEEAPFNNPRYNLGGDPYFTDGLRAVFLLADLPIPYDKIDFVQWDFPPKFDKYKDVWFAEPVPEGTE